MKNIKFLNKNLLKISLVVLVLSILVVPVVSFAQASGPSRGGSASGPARVDSTNDAGSVKIQNPIKVNTINGFIKLILEGVLKIGIPIVSLALIYCGFLFVKARGKSGELNKAKDALLYTVIGAAILLGSWTIAQLISDTVLSL